MVVTTSNLGEDITSYVETEPVDMAIFLNSYKRVDGVVMYDAYSHIGLTQDDIELNRGDIIEDKYEVVRTLPSRVYKRVFLMEITDAS